MSLQRNNFRCARDGVAVSPLKPSSSSSGIVLNHSELPPRQRKRVQVGTTNLSRSVSTPELASPLPALGDVSAAAHHICATNIDVMKQSMHSSSRASMKGHGHRDALVVSGNRRRQDLAASLSTTGDKSTQQASESHSIEDDAEAATANVAPISPFNGDRVFLTETRHKLYNAFVNRYGSVRAVFKAFDRDAHGHISFQRFADMVEASAVDMSPEDVRRVFVHVDTNRDNSIEYQEFSEMFTASEYVEHASAYSPSKAKAAAVTGDIASSLALKFRAPLDLSLAERERMKELRLKVNGELLHKHGRDVSVHGGKTENLLIYAFKQFDDDNDGFISYDQVKSALGKDYLQLSIDPVEMDEMVKMIDRNADERISMKEFVQYFGAGKRELPTDLIDNGRRKELAALHFKANAALTPRQEFDPEYFERPAAVGPSATDDGPSLEPTGCMQENLLKRVATSPVFRKPAVSVPKDALLRAQTAHAPLGSSSSTPTLAKRDLGPTLNPLVTVSQDRFEYWRQIQTDWARIGNGGDGVEPGTALHLSERERFRTTTAQAFTPMRRGVNSGDVYRDEKSTAEVEADARASRRQARHERTQALLVEMDVQRAKDQRLKEWKARAKVRLGAERRFQYLDKIHDQEQRVAMREQQMAKRHGGVRFHRMWAGSPESQFNNTHVTAQYQEELSDFNQ